MKTMMKILRSVFEPDYYRKLREKQREEAAEDVRKKLLSRSQYIEENE